VLKARGLEPQSAAQLLGCNISTVYDWLRGKDPRNVDLIQRGIAATLDMRLAENGEAEHGKPGHARKDAVLFRNFTARVAGHKQLRRVIEALAEDSREKQFFKRAMKRAEALERESIE
jgi:hypothetical protein